jgi:lipooligosaccharide transport system permease protein
MKVWRRNFTVYRRIWKINFLPPLLEPLFYIFAFGAGLGTLVGSISYDGNAVSYIGFIAPALVAINIMYNTFFETTYASFVRMYYQKTFDAMLATPLSIQEIITGEIVWGATKSVIGTSIMLAVISFFGILTYPAVLLAIPLSFIGGIAFGAIGMFFTSVIPSIDSFNLPVFLFITPMFLLSGTFFPLENLPAWVQKTAFAFPLTHLVKLTRAFSLGHFEWGLLWDILYLIGFSVLFFPVAIRGMRKRLIQ